MARLLEEERYHLPFLFVFLLVLNFPFLGARDLWAPVEPRYGEIVRVMFARGDWIVPTVNGEVYTDKPILYFWLVLVFSYLAGGVTEWSVRLPSALSATGVALMAYLLGRHHFGSRVGLLASLVFATTARVIWEARWAHTDMLFTFFFISALYFLLRIWMGQENKSEAVLAFICVSLATLTKGLIGFVLPGLIVAAVVAWTRDWNKLRAFRLPVGAVVFAIVTLPWFFAVSYRTDGFWIRDFIWTHHVRRYLAGAGHEEPFYYYFINFPLDFLPWTLILVPALWAYWPKRKTLTQPLPLFLTAWFLVVFAFFSFSDTKRGLYLLPLFPPAALLVAHYLYEVEAGLASGVKGVRVAFYLICALLVLTGLSAPFAAVKFAPLALNAALALAVVLAGAAFLLFRRLTAGRYFLASLGLGLTVVVSMLWAQVAVFPRINDHKSPRLFAAEIGNHVDEQDKLYIYADTMNDFNFYLEREVIPVLSEPQDVAALAGEKGWVYLLLRDRRADRAAVEKTLAWDLVTRGKTGGKEWLLLRLKA